MAYDGGISSVLNNKLTYKFKVGKYLDTYTPSLFVKNFILPKEREEGIAVYDHGGTTLDK